MNQSRDHQSQCLAVNSRIVPESAIDEILASLHGIQFGSVSIIVQDGVIVQIDRVEKRRLKPGESSKYHQRGE